MAARGQEGGYQRQLGAGKLRAAEATQRQYTKANDNGDDHSDRREHAGAHVSITEGVKATNKPRRRGVIQVATPAQSNKVRVSSGCATATHDGGQWREHRPLEPRRCARINRGGQGETHKPQLL